MAIAILALMKTCPSCGNTNPPDFDFCRYCGHPLADVPSKQKGNFLKHLPSWAWILIIIGGLIAFIAIIVGSFVGLATVEGFASVVLLCCGVIGFGVYPLRKPEATDPIFRAIGISFFALMGATIDQTGNLIYNKPVEVCFCHDGTSLIRKQEVSNPLPGTTYIQEDYTCYDDAGNPVKRINTFAVLGIRFIEYVFIGYLLLLLRRFIWRTKNKN